MCSVRAPARDPTQRSLQRICVVHGLGVELAAGQTHRLALQDVDRRQQDHARAAAGRGCAEDARRLMATKFSSMRRP